MLVSDDAAVYRDFTHAQKCWAHLIRKAIRLTLLQPDHEDYRTFLTGLLELYHKACRLKQDRRLKPSTRPPQTVSKPAAYSAHRNAKPFHSSLNNDTDHYTI